MIDWDAIFKANGPAVWRTLYRILGSRADSDECLQEVFLAAVNVSRSQPIRNWPAWLQRLAVHRAIDQLRRRKRTPRGFGHESVESLAGSAPDCFESVQAAERAECVRSAIARLPTQQAQAITLHMLNGWTYQSIAQELGTSAVNVGVLIHRAKSRLRELLQDRSDIRPENVP